MHQIVRRTMQLAKGHKPGRHGWFSPVNVPVTATAR